MVLVVVGALCVDTIDVQASDSNLIVLASRRFHDLTRAEKRVLEYVDIDNSNRGEWATCGPSSDIKNPTNDPKDAAAWGHERDVRAAMIRWLAADVKASARVDPKGVRVLGARIIGPLDLSHIHVPFAIALVLCSIPERMNLEATNIPFFDLSSSRVGEIYGQSMVVEGDLNIGYDNVDFPEDFWASGEVFLSGSKVGGSLSFGGGHFMHSKVEPMGWGADQKKSIDLGSIEVKGDLVMCCGFKSDGAVKMDGAKVANFNLIGGQFRNPNNIALSAFAVTVEGDVIWFPYEQDSPAADGDVSFVTARVGGNFIVEHARFSGTPGEHHGFVASGLSVGKVFVWRNVTLENDAVLELNGAHVGGLLDNEQSWPSPGKLLLDGFTYNGFGTGTGGLFGKDTPRDAASRLRWLRLQPRFYPQPYVQLAKVLRDNGDEEGAATVLAAQEEAAQSPNSGPLRRLMNSKRSALIILSVITLLAISATTVILAGRERWSHVPIDAAMLGAKKGGVEAESSFSRLHLHAENGKPALESAEGTLNSNEPGIFEGTPGGAAVFIQQGEFWTITYLSKTFRLRDAKGLHYIAYLLAHPGERIHVNDLVEVVGGSAVGGREATYAQSEDLEIVREIGDRGPTIDARARAEYSARLRDLQTELDEAESMNDIGRSERLRTELDMVSQELIGASGLGGRRAGAGAERARGLVSKRIRATLEKIRAESSRLGRHFEKSIKTGYFCAYLPDPDHKITWQM
jgi:hypothetical protein